MSLSDRSHPIIAVNVNSICPNPMDMDIYKVSIQGGILKIYGEDKEYGNDVPLNPEDVFAGHLSSIIDYIPATGDVEDVTCQQESFPITHISRDDVASKGYDTSNTSDEDMNELARKMGNAYCEDGYWEDMAIIADYLNIPRTVK